jgi:hypothetical protein
MTKSLYLLYLFVLIIFFIIIKWFFFKKELFQAETTSAIVCSRDVMDTQDFARCEAERDPNIAGPTRHNHITAQTDANSECCGVTIYQNSLNNINKCVIQHLAPGDNSLLPRFQDWKEIDESNTCKSPHNILAKTSNCNNIVTSLSSNIQNLLKVSETIENAGSSSCKYNYQLNQLRDERSGLTEYERFLLWQNNIPCDFRGGGLAGDAQNFEFGNQSDVEYTYFNCE